MLVEIAIMNTVVEIAYNLILPILISCSNARQHVDVLLIIGELYAYLLRLLCIIRLYVVIFLTCPLILNFNVKLIYALRFSSFCHKFSEGANILVVLPILNIVPIF